MHDGDGVIREKAGMGSNPDPFYTNMCESMNCTLKRCSGFTAQRPLKQFLSYR